MGDVASKFLLDEEKYKDVLSGWNQKLNSSSLKLSGLTPFVELYAVFKNDDIIFSAKNNAFSSISDRMTQVELVNNGKTDTVKIVPICSTNKSQLEPDSIYGSSYRGAAGVNDLQVARGASASLNVKYDLQITIPNPEIVNELYEYSRIMTLNSTFLLIYGWNPEGYDVTPPPGIDGGLTPKILVDNNKGGGFYESSLVSLYRFDFSFDNVGHLTGKLSFLPEHGNFLVGTRTDTIATSVLERLTKYDGQISEGDGNRIGGLKDDYEQTLRDLSENKKLNDLMIKEIDDALKARPQLEVAFLALTEQERFEKLQAEQSNRIREKLINIRQQIVGSAPPNWNPDEQPDPFRAPWNQSYRIIKLKFIDQLINDSIIANPQKIKNNKYYSSGNTIYASTYISAQNNFKRKQLEEITGYTTFENGMPWEIEQGTANFTADDLIRKMPSYGKELQQNIFSDFNTKGNPNKALFYDDNDRVSDKFDAQTKSIWRSTSCVSVMMFNLYDPNSEEEDQRQPESEFVKNSKITLNDGSDRVEAGVSIQAQPIYFFLGSVLEAISRSTNKKVKFFYRDLEDNHSIPIPSVSKNTLENQKKQLDEALSAIIKDIEEIKDREDKGLNEEGEPFTDEEKEDLRDEELSKKEEKLFIENSLNNLEGLQPLVRNFFNTLEVKNTFELPVDINSVKQVLTQEGDAPLHNLIKKVVELCNSTNPTLKVATRPYKNSDTIEIYVANMKVEGISKEVFESIEVRITEDGSAEDFNRVSREFSERAVVCEFGTERSLVENFSLNSKVDPLAFAAFRLPSVIGGQSIDVQDLVRRKINETGDVNAGFMADITSTLQNSLISSRKELEALEIVSLDNNGNVLNVNKENLRDFLSAPGANGSAGRQVISRLIDELRASNVTFNNNIIAAQNEDFLSSGEKNGRKPSFFGGILSSFLRSITLTVHGVVGLTMFNIVYIKGLMRGIEGVYMITSVSESLTPSNFSTTLECKLVNYKNSNPNTNPFAQREYTTLSELVKSTDPDKDFTLNTTYQNLFDQTERRLKDAADRTNFIWGSG